jgi:hypothetical protein
MVPLLTPLFFGWTISLRQYTYVYLLAFFVDCVFYVTNAVKFAWPSAMKTKALLTIYEIIMTGFPQKNTYTQEKGMYSMYIKVNLLFKQLYLLYDSFLHNVVHTTECSDFLKSLFVRFLVSKCAKSAT